MNTSLRIPTIVLLLITVSYTAFAHDGGVGSFLGFSILMIFVALLYAGILNVSTKFQLAIFFSGVVVEIVYMYLRNLILGRSDIFIEWVDFFVMLAIVSASSFGFARLNKLTQQRADRSDLEDAPKE